MLTLWTWGTVNGRKPIILLEELGLAYNIRPVDLTRKQQLEPEFRKLNPIGKIPVLVDEDDGPIIESNAILWYLGNKTGRLLGEGDRVSKVMQWLFFEAATAGPPLVNRWRLRHRLPEKPPSEVERHRGDSERALAMIEETLAMLHLDDPQRPIERGVDRPLPGRLIWRNTIPVPPQYQQQLSAEPDRA